MGTPKQLSSNKDKAEAEYTISNWDAKGRAKLDQLAKEKEKVSQRMYEGAPFALLREGVRSFV